MFGPEVIQKWREWQELADELGLPHEWRVCAHCGEQSWCFPPHLLSPCPFVSEMAQAAGMKMDAERMQAVRTGVNIEAVTELFRTMIEDAEEE